MDSNNLLLMSSMQQVYCEIIMNMNFIEKLYCELNEPFSGYKYSYPFLSGSTGIEVDDNYVSPLFQQILNIRHPTMAFIGIPVPSNNYLIDLQVRTLDKSISPSL